MKQPLKMPPLPPARLDIINLIDILITLIAFFLLTSVFAEKKDQVRINPPELSQRSGSIQPQKPLTVGITKANKVYFEGRQISLQRLPQLLQNYSGSASLIIRADEECRYGSVMNVLDTLRKQGFTKVAFEVRLEP